MSVINIEAGVNSFLDKGHVELSLIHGEFIEYTLRSYLGVKSFEPYQETIKASIKCLEDFNNFFRTRDFGSTDTIVANCKRINIIIPLSKINNMLISKVFKNIPDDMFDKALDLMKQEVDNHIERYEL